MSNVINLRNTVMTNNYDLNIWDRRGYETEYQEEGWAIECYTYPYAGAFYGSGEYHSTIHLTPEEAKRLTLGWGTDLGGDYTPDSDFWLDKQTFLEIYTDIPERVSNLLWALPEYEQSVEELTLSEALRYNGKQYD
jgi:hypothetical protein